MAVEKKKLKGKRCHVRWRGVNAIRLYPGNHRSGNGMHLATRTQNGIHSVYTYASNDGSWPVERSRVNYRKGFQPRGGNRYTFGRKMLTRY